MVLPYTPAEKLRRSGSGSLPRSPLPDNFMLE